MSDTITTITHLKSKVLQFVNDREWGQFHSPKNMSMCVATEAAELMEIFLWCQTQEASEVLEEKRQEVEHEAADVAIALLLFCQENTIDLTQAIEKKLQLNAEKYPVEKAKGKSTKYTEL